MDPHFIFDILSLLGIFAASWVGLALKSILSKVERNQLTAKAELIAKQTEIKEDLTEKHAENRKDLAIHSARDDEQFKSINKTLDRIESKLDHITSHG